MLFLYKAADATGKIHTGQRAAGSREELLRALKDDGFFPLEVTEVEEKKVRPRQRRIAKKDLLVFTRQLAGLLEAGMQLDRSLQITARLLEKTAMGAVTLELQRLMQEGASFSQALESHEEIFGPLYINLVRGGESSGLLPHVMTRLADSLEKEIKLKGDIFSSLLYPALVTMASIVATIILLQVVVPRFEELFLRMGQDLPLLTRLVLNFRSKTVRYGPFLLMAVFAGGIFFFQYLRTENGKLTWDRFCLRLPLLGPILLQLNIAAFARMLGLMLQSGVSLLDSLSLLKNTITNKFLARTIAQAEIEVRKGGTLGRFFATQNELPLLLAQMTGVGEEGGNLDEMLLNLARLYEREARQKIENLIALLGPLLILALTGIIFLIALAVLLPIMSINIQPM